MSGDYLPLAQLTSSGRPVLHPSEVESTLLSAVDLLAEETPTFPHLKSALLILTTHRLIFLPTATSSSPLYIPLSSITHIFSHKKSIKSIFSTPRVRFQASTTSDGLIVDQLSVDQYVKSIVITLIVRGKNDPELFLGKLWEAWRGRAWEASTASASALGKRAEESLAIRAPVVGVAGILRKEQELWENTDKSLQDAFQDLNALMSKAKEMVMLAEKMRQKLLSGSNNQPSGANDEEMGTKEEMQDWLLSVGIVSPVTKESAGALYHQQLSRQLADFVKSPLERSGGTLNLIDVYCLFNRARGTELISPDDLLQACSLWEKFDVYELSGILYSFVVYIAICIARIFITKLINS
ncbi:hypothetical protein Leryth_002085 [Lithospermum erythrorhizon]|nr:hypothetical protein Leryth_002085 [Lithospermum erythrorhizon]